MLISLYLGIGVIPEIMNAEIYPLWARGIGNAMALSTAWVTFFVISKTFLSLVDAINRYGEYLSK